MSGERLAWPVDQLDVQPGDRLDGGTITAIDRSRKMIDAATQRNREHGDTGRASFEVAAVEDADLGDERFDRLSR